MEKEDGSWACERCSFVNKSTDSKCTMCEESVELLDDKSIDVYAYHYCDEAYDEFLMEDNLTHPESPDYDKIINDYLADGEDGSSEDDEVGAKKDEPKIENKTAAKEIPDQQKDKTSVAGPSNWKKRQNRKRDRKQAKKPRAELSSSSDEVNTT
ncbi:hypothetical protein DAPPUDRAFT_327254 [Daphnia pulex]|uniref:RanBP2-type domain-containing protein n=1 Tax=Daphnia pulex TaxID=6669 RepID=E9HA74_DAPPU|nr:hypothetical protein DAPPUDRAFT_327254 [Daphnia pulex]|eukprot:EFX71398.1 hypothetical protein DAPPUDRAFT_327254 [Daphnia pulex]